MNNVCWSPFPFYELCNRAKLWPLVSRNSYDIPEPCLPSAMICGVVCVIWPQSCDSQHHEQSQPLPEVIGTCCRTFWLQQSTVCACCIPHGCAAECSSTTTHCSIMAVRSPDLLVFPRGNEALPQTVPQLQKAVPVSQLVWCTTWDGGLCQTLCDRYRTTTSCTCLLCVGRAWCLDWLSPVT